jgi:hypothetical protein
MGLKREEIENDPLVKQTLKVCADFLRGQYGRDADDTRELIPPMEEIPGARVLLALDEMDPVCASVLVVTPLMTILPIEEIEDKLDPAVADALKQFTLDLADGPEALLASGNPHVLKLLVATIAGSVDADTLREMRAGMHASDVREMTSEVTDIIVAIGEHLTEGDRWKALSPKLLDCYLEGIDNLASVTPGRFQKRVLGELAREVKEHVAKGVADEITAASAANAPQIDPESKFEQLKNSARKFKPGGLNG